MALGLRLELTKVKLWQHILSGFVRKENPIEFEQTRDPTSDQYYSRERPLPPSVNPSHHLIQS